MIIRSRYHFWEWEYFDEKTKKWEMRNDAPEWAKKEFKEFYGLLKETKTINGEVITILR